MGFIDELRNRLHSKATNVVKVERRTGNGKRETGKRKMGTKRNLNPKPISNFGPFNQNFRKFGNTGKWCSTFPEKFPENPETVEFPKCEPFNRKF